jgi:hypothetical protein
MALSSQKLGYRYSIKASSQFTHIYQLNVSCGQDSVSVIVHWRPLIWKHRPNRRGDQEGLFKLVTLDRILNRITGVTSGCWWLVVVNAIPISDICQINQQKISSCSVINNRIKKFS